MTSKGWYSINTKQKQRHKNKSKTDRDTKKIPKVTQKIRKIIKNQLLEDIFVSVSVLLVFLCLYDFLICTECTPAGWRRASLENQLMRKSQNLHFSWPRYLCVSSAHETRHTRNNHNQQTKLQFHEFHDYLKW